MPRAVDPRLGEDGYEGEVIDRFAIGDTALASLAKYFGDPPVVDLAYLEHWVGEIAMDYQRSAGRGADGFDRKEARAAIDHVLALQMITCRDIQRLNGRAEDVVVNELMLMTDVVRQGGGVYERLWADELAPEHLRQACERARDRLIATKGADKNLALAHCVYQLCEFYERTTGILITLSNRDKDGAYTQEPHSEGARFVREALMLIAKDSGDRNRKQAASAYIGYVRSWIRRRSLVD